ncbi:MAG: HAD family phosphatase [Chloroflexi bacterium]|nr:HAD family phosphatase [Chloroflexota bacterium]
MIEQFKPARPIRLIAVDIDHTLLNSQQQLSERTGRALRAAIERGVRVVLATGKSFYSAAGLIEQLGLTTPCIFSQGTTMYNPDGTLRHQQLLDPAIARQVITYAEDRGYGIALYSGTRVLTRRRDAPMFDLNVRYGEPMEATVPLQNLLDSMPVNKLVVTGSDAKVVKALRWQLGMQFNGSARLLQAGVPSMMEILPPGASKGAMLKVLLRELEIAPDEMLAAGDAENDIEMVQMAGVGVAVGNAGESLKQVADYIAASNDEDGVAEAVERFVLLTHNTDDSAAPVGATEVNGS